jgi:hypothetical protein
MNKTELRQIRQTRVGMFSHDARARHRGWGDDWDEIDEQLNEALEQDEEREEAAGAAGGRSAGGGPEALGPQ